MRVCADLALAGLGCYGDMSALKTPAREDRGAALPVGAIYRSCVSLEAVQRHLDAGSVRAW